MTADLAEAQQRYKAMADSFEQRFSTPASLFARAPGRVNIIGEHIDYEGYGVLPMAIARDVVVAIAVGGKTIDVANHSNVRSLIGYFLQAFAPVERSVVEIVVSRRHFPLFAVVFCSVSFTN